MHVSEVCKGISCALPAKHATRLGSDDETVQVGKFTIQLDAGDAEDYMDFVIGL